MISHGRGSVWAVVCISRPWARPDGPDVRYHTHMASAIGRGKVQREPQEAPTLSDRGYANF